MSSSFWKFGQDYSNESSLAKLLNNAFIKIESNEISDNNQNRNNSSSKNDTEIKVKLDSPKNEEDLQEEDNEESNSKKNQHVELPDTETGFKDYEPNLDVLNNLLDEEELYTELMCSNFKLLIYLKYPAVLSKLIDYVMVDNILAKDEKKRKELINNGDRDINKLKNIPSDIVNNNNNNEENFEEGTEKIEIEEEEEDIESQRAHMAAEILSADVWPISAAIMEHEDLLEKLWSITNLAGELPIEASTYFMKINDRLLDMNMSGMIEFILTQDNIVDRFLNHIDDPPLIDFFLKVISTDKPDINNGVIKRLKEQGLIPKLIELLNPEYNHSVQSAAADFLKALLAISGNCVDEIASSIGPNELTRQLASPKVMERLIQIMLKGGTSLNNGVGIIIELIRKNNSDYDYVQIMFTTLETHPPNDRDSIYLGHMLKLFHKYMPKFNDILVNTSMPILDTSFGRIEPLGFERFKICELIAELLHCSNMGLVNEKKGEDIVLERDRVRARLLADENDNYSENDDEENSSREQNDVTESLNSLTIENGPHQNETDKSSINIDNNYNNMEEHSEEFSEVIPDDESEIEKLKEKAVVGDLLKMSLLDTQIITTIIEMFFHFSWNNFLHNVVFDIIQQIFNGPLKSGFNRFLIKDLLTNTELTKLIIEGERDCVRQEEEKKPRLGYIGHLTLIAEEIVKFSAYLDEMNINFTTNTINDCLADSNWKDYVETTLSNRREQYDLVLGDIPPNGDGENDDYDDEDSNEDRFSEHVYGTEHIIFTNDLDEDGEDIDNDNEDPYEDAINHLPGEKEDNADVKEGEENVDDEYESNNHKDSTSFLSSSESEKNFVQNDNILINITDTTKGLQNNEEEEEYAEYSERDNKNYYQYVDSNMKKAGTYVATIDSHHDDEESENNDGKMHRKQYSPSKFGQTITKTVIPTSPAGFFDYEISSSDEEDNLVSSQDYIEQNDKRRKLSKRGGYCDDEENNDDLLEDTTLSETAAWNGESRSPSFKLNRVSNNNKPSLAQLHDEDIFQHQFEMDMMHDSSVYPGLSRVDSTTINDISIAHVIPIMSLQDESDDEDNYLDPNDDGQSYAKPNNPLYNDTMKGMASYYSNSVYYSSEGYTTADNGSDEEESSENSDEGEMDHKLLNNLQDSSMEESFILYRSASHDEEKWS
ncbi:hypothetical protein RI543_001868 [Arxiozyma heterogenica]|uniref:SIT4-associating protein SAP190 n=1 Tax=Arxiozyma heterogenica TaxID=278026 RepID=A0AAN8A8U7_9SACH|nr:hypothetical protein RI543_001868 [Kazachstania heterogenica]